MEEQSVSTNCKLKVKTIGRFKIALRKTYFVEDNTIVLKRTDQVDDHVEDDELLLPRSVAADH